LTKTGMMVSSQSAASSATCPLYPVLVFADTILCSYWHVLLLPLCTASWNTWLQPKNDAKESGMRKGQALCANIKSQVMTSADSLSIVVLTSVHKWYA
jgi:hypothetical protein